MSEKQTIFLTGATGYIGGSVLWRLINHKDAKDFNIRVLVRNADKAKVFQEKYGLDTVVGSHSDAEKLEALAAEADIVISVADSDDLQATQAILRGLKKYHENTSKVPTYIHTSGSGVIADGAGGMYASEKIYDDAKVEDFETLPKTQIHREVDIEVVEADKAGYVRTYIILPPTIYGIAKNGFTEAGLQNTFSFQIPALIRASVARGQGGMVGLGKNKWANVHNDDVADFYIVLLQNIHADVNSVPHGREGFFFTVGDEHDMYTLSKAVSQALVDLGKGQSSEPSTFTKEEIEKYLGFDFLGPNSRCKPTRSLALGWKPKYTTKDLLDSMKSQVEALIAAGKA